MENSNETYDQHDIWDNADLMGDPEPEEENTFIVDTSQENIDRLMLELSNADKSVEEAKGKARKLWLIPIDSIGSKQWNENMNRAHKVVEEAKDKYGRISQELSYIKNSIGDKK